MSKPTQIAQLARNIKVAFSPKDKVVVENVTGRQMLKTTSLITHGKIICPDCMRNEWELSVNNRIRCSYCLAEFHNYGIAGLERVEGTQQGQFSLLKAIK